MATTLFDSNIQSEEFSVVLQRAYAAYGLWVVTDRALPDARDGLKPVQRRILYGMLARRYLSTRSTVKSAEIVGTILGDYHPHGDASVYDAMVRMAQEFTMRYPLVQGQGNFGSLDGDPPAAYRYTEARLSPMAETFMADIEKDTVSWRPTYKQDLRVQEPDYLPGRIPPVINPSSGIAVGLSTNILPHNLGETMRAAIALLDKPTMTVDELLKYIKGPDFTSGGRVMGIEGVKDYLRTGKGRIVVRGEVRLEENPRTRQRSLIVVGLPPIGRDRLKATMVKAINERKLEGLVPDVRDESDTEKGTRIVLELKKDAQPAQVLQQLYNDTDLQVAVTAQMVFLFGEPMAAARQPKQVGMVELLNYWNAHQQDVLRRRSQYDLTKAQERLHIVEGLIIGSANAQQIVKIFQEAATREEARQKIQTKYKLTERQVSVIADMTLSQVTRMDAGKYTQEKAELQAQIAELEDLLANPVKLITLLKKEMQELIKRFGDDRRTIIEAEGNAQTAVSEVASLVDRKALLIALTRDSTVRSLPLDTYTKGKKTADGFVVTLPRGDDQLAVSPLLSSTRDHLLFITDQGRAYGLPVTEIPEGTRSAKGESLKTLLTLGKGERIVAVVSIPDFDEGGQIVEFTRLGKLKKAPISEYRTVDDKGAPDFKLADGDAVIGAVLLPAPQEGATVVPGEYLITTDRGQTLRFSDEDVRIQQGRVSQGIQSINLPAGASVVGADYLAAGTDAKRFLLVITDNGQGKKVSLDQYTPKGRATNGLATLDLVANKAERVTAAQVIGSQGQAIVVTAKGQAIGLNTAALTGATRTQKAETLINLDKPGDTVQTLFSL